MNMELESNSKDNGSSFSSPDLELSVNTSSFPLSDATEKSSFDEKQEEKIKESSKMLIKESHSKNNKNKKNLTGLITIPEAILNEAQIKLKEENEHSTPLSDGEENNNNFLNQNNKSSSGLSLSESSEESSGTNNSALELNNQLNMLERILFPETHHKIITPRITITIDPSMAFDECEEEDDEDDVCDVDSDDEDLEDDDSSSVFLELASDTGMSDKTLAELEMVGVESSKDSDGSGRARAGSIIIDESGLIITCEKYGKVPILLSDEDHHLDGSPLRSASDGELDTNVNNNSNANLNEGGGGEEERSRHSSEEEPNNVSECQSGDCPSPRSNKLGRASSSPSNTNLSEPSSEPGERVLKIEEAKPRRRNTIADIFRWLIESDSKSCNSLPGAANNSTHSRKSSDTSELSLGQSSDKGSEQETEEDLWITWGRIVNEWETYWKKKNQFVRDLVKRGIPHHFRGIVWQLLCLAHDSPDKAKYADYIKATSACEKVIRRDIARTYPEHDFFKEKDGLGQESLFNVMKAYSLHDREVGYCQGSAFIVGLLLMQMPEEEAFAVLVKLMQDYRLREMFKPSMAELGLCMYQLEMCVQEQYPELHVHFTSQGFHTSMYASSWFLTIFTTSLPLAVASRIMDVFLMDGIEVVFRIALAILSMAKHELLSLDMEGMLKYLQKELPPQIEAEPENLFSIAFNVKYNAKKMKKLEKDYAAMKTKEQEEMVELRV